MNELKVLRRFNSSFVSLFLRRECGGGYSGREMSPALPGKSHMAEVMCAGEDIGTRYRYKKTGRNAEGQILLKNSMIQKDHK